MADKEQLAPFKNHNINSKIIRDNRELSVKRNFKQKLYTHNGKNKILLYETEGTGIYIDILYENGKLNVTSDYLYKYSGMDIKYKIENGRPVNLFKLSK